MANLEVLIANAWAEGFRAAEAIHSTTITYGDVPVDGTRATMRRIVEEVARKHNFRPDDLKSARRAKSLSVARHEAMWRCRQETLCSYPQIGRALGNRDHSTVMHGCRQHEERMVKEGRGE